MRTSELTSSGTTDCCIEDEYWSTGWKTHIYTLPNGDDYLLRYLPSTQQIRIAPLTSGVIEADVLNSTWNQGYDQFTSLQHGASTYLVALTQSGDLEVFEAQSNGTLIATNTLTTVLTNWTTFNSYTLEDTAIVHLYRSSDGFFTLYELNNSGELIGPIETGFEEMGWSSMQHFKTTP